MVRVATSGFTSNPPARNAAKVVRRSNTWSRMKMDLVFSVLKNNFLTHVLGNSWSRRDYNELSWQAEWVESCSRLLRVDLLRRERNSQDSILAPQVCRRLARGGRPIFLMRKELASSVPRLYFPSRLIVRIVLRSWWSHKPLPPGHRISAIAHRRVSAFPCKKEMAASQFTHNPIRYSQAVGIPAPRKSVLVGQDDNRFLGIVDESAGAPAIGRSGSGASEHVPESNRRAGCPVP